MNDEVIRERALNPQESFIVQAPAGSGKTSLLTQRFLSLLAHVEEVPEEILAITFTRKSAQEMRSRILTALELALEQDITDDLYQQKNQLLARKVLACDNKAKWNLLENPKRLKIHTIDAAVSYTHLTLPTKA